jgi:hypothetical protein
MKRLFTFLVLLTVIGSEESRAQNVIEGTEDLDFDRPESWAMKYFASLSLLTGMGVPDPMGKGAIALGFEGGYVPQLSEEERRVGFEGTKIEDLNRTHFFGRIRGKIGLGEKYVLELAYLPPFDVGGTKPNLFAAALGRPFVLSDTFQLGLRGYTQIGTIEGDITCSSDDLEGENPFRCEAPSNDELGQFLLGAELTAGYVSDSPFRPYVGIAFNYLDLEFQIDARYSGLVDRTLQFTDGGTVSITTGLAWVPTPKWTITGEIFYSWLSITRPPATSSSNEGLLNGRFLVSYRIR